MLLQRIILWHILSKRPERLLKNIWKADYSGLCTGTFRGHKHLIQSMYYESAGLFLDSKCGSMPNVNCSLKESAGTAPRR